ncbi:uncharacterized protein LOC115223998, partial [Argonauta hians]
DLPGDSMLQLRNKISEDIRPYLFDSNLFNHSIFKKITPNFNDLDFEKATIAFYNLEKYARLLYRFPWKDEFRTLKTYCGFYRTMVDNLMPYTREIFSAFGYVPSNRNGHEFNTILQLDSDPCPETLLTVGFDCIKASAQFKYMYDLSCNLSSNLNLKTIPPKQLSLPMLDIKKQSKSDYHKHTRLSKRFYSSLESKKRDNYCIPCREVKAAGNFHGSMLFEKIKTHDNTADLSSINLCYNK